MAGLIVANWKLNGSLSFVDSYFNSLNGNQFKNKIVICPPSIYINSVKSKAKNELISIGAQSFSNHQNGSFTGCLAPSMLVDVGCEYAVVAHDEDRLERSLSLSSVVDMISSGIDVGLKIIFCIGSKRIAKSELLNSEDFFKELNIVFKQLSNRGYFSKGSSIKEQLILAYEPSDSRGGSDISAIDSISSNISKIIDVCRLYNIDLMVIYGGSVNAQNIEQLSNLSNLSGVMLGRSSLNPEELIQVDALISI